MHEELQELIERIDACDAEINGLSADITSYFEKHLEHWIAYKDGFTMLCAKVDRLPPTRIRSKTGMIANELRSVLDSLACHLAERHSQTSKETYFPISKSEAIFRSDGHKKMKKLHPADQAAIEALKPWKDGHDILFPLHKADLLRKHRKLLAASGSGQMVIAEGQAGFFLHYVGRAEGIIQNANEYFLMQEWQNIISAAEIVPNFFMMYLEPEDLSGKEVVEFLNRSSATVREIVLIFA